MSALIVEFHFLMPRPKSHFREKSGLLRPEAPVAHLKKPDATKLVRSTEDALTGIVWHDDTNICGQIITKAYTNDQTGAIIRIHPVTQQDFHILLHRLTLANIRGTMSVTQT